MQWYYAKDGRQDGPVEGSTLQAKLQTGELAPTDLVWSDGMTDWVPAGQVPELLGQAGSESAGPPATPSPSEPSPEPSPVSTAEAAPATPEAPGAEPTSTAEPVTAPSAEVDLSKLVTTAPGAAPSTPESGAVDPSSAPADPSAAAGPTATGEIPITQPQPGAPIIVAPPPTSGLAIASLVCGILALLLCYVWALAGIPAVITGHMALKRLRADPNGMMQGRGMAIAGLVTGYLGILFQILMIAGIAFFVVSAQP